MDSLTILVYSVTLKDIYLDFLDLFKKVAVIIENVNKGILQMLTYSFICQTLIVYVLFGKHCANSGGTRISKTHRYPKNGRG